MKIICTVKEFGQIVRGCEKRSCYQCPLEDVCGDHPEGNGIEQFVSAENVVEDEAVDVLHEFLAKEGVSDG